jgi:hypothetical protein
MRRDLGLITSASGRVSSDARRLEVAMAHANVQGVKAAAVRLKVDARHYSTRAGLAGNKIRRLAREAPTGTVQLYLSQVTRALSWEWVEGVALAFLADQAWADPLSVRGGSSQRLAADLKWARNAAARAMQASATAQAIMHRSKSQFRYTAVTPGV